MPRLVKGQIAPGIRQLSLAASAAASRRVEAFNALLVASSPTLDIVDRFRSLASLASWHDVEIDMSPISEKTLRKHIDSTYEGGYHRFRKDTKKFIEQFDAVTKESARSRNEATTLVDHSCKNADAALSMTARYLDLLTRLRRLATGDETVERELSNHMKKFGPGAPHIRVVK